jgi:bacillithiol synthase
VLEYFRGDPSSIDAFRAKADEVDGRFDVARRRRALEAVYVPDVIDDARRDEWVERDGLMVTTGQQPGLFGGPLYSLYKAIGALKLSQGLEEALGRPVLPVFWIASDDHDWAEADHTYILDSANELRLVRVADPGHADRALHRIELGRELSDALTEFLEDLPKTDFSAPYIELLREAYAPGATLAGGFAAVMRALLGPLGICVTDAADPVVKAESAPVLMAELDGGASHEAALRERAAALEAAGYQLQVPILEGGVNLFLEGPAGRERLYRDGSGFVLRRSETPVSREEVESRFEADHRTLSPNVLLRPVVESHVFPTLSYVAGPGELAYFAEVSPLFDAHGIGMPIITPRPAFTVVESKIGKVLGKFGLPLEELARPHHELASEIAREELPDDIRQALADLRGTVGQGSTKLLEAAKKIDPTLKGPVNHVRNTAFHEVAEVEKKIIQSLKRESEIALAQLDKAQRHLFPGGKPQERMLSPFYYLARYGNSFIEALVDEVVVDLTGVTS